MSTPLCLCAKSRVALVGAAKFTVCGFTRFSERLLVSHQRGRHWSSSADGPSPLSAPPQEWWFSNSRLTEDHWRRTVQSLPSWEKILANKVNVQDIQKNKFLMRVNILDNPF